MSPNRSRQHEVESSVEDGQVKVGVEIEPRSLSEYYRGGFSIEQGRATMMCGQDLPLLPARTIAAATA